MKRLVLSLFLALLLLTPLTVHAERDYVSEMEELLSDQAVTEEELSRRIGVEATMKELIAVLSGELPEAVRFFLLLLAVAVLESLSSLLGERRPELRATVRATVECVLAVTLVGTLSPLIYDVLSSLSSLATLSGGMIPIFVGIHTAMGRGESALATAAGLGALVSLLEGMLGGVLLPLLGVYLAISLIGGMDKEGGLAQLSERIYKLFLFLFGLGTAILAGVMSLQSVLSQSKDTLTLRAIKQATGSMLPIVGSTVSGALSTLLASGIYLKDTVGVMALVAVLSVVLPLFCRLLLCRMALGTLTLLPGLAASESTAVSTVRRMLELLFALYALASVLLLFGIVLFMKNGKYLI